MSESTTLLPKTLENLSHNLEVLRKNHHLVMDATSKNKTTMENENEKGTNGA